MTDKEVIIDGYKLEDIKNLLYTGQKMAISTKTFEALIDKFECLQAENKELKTFKDKIMKPIILPMDNEPEIINLADRYKQALEKIKNEINNTPRHYWGQRHVEFLDIINEVLKDE